ncbi:protein-tyrosine phosphatase family protein [Bdellovibrio svalbardensis]|uniref:Tyrosine specific protein phosphatases domain-containing protein n=1 Tax=Bdellovibrio svalbardensis TaxID=2972972 RepID=A0ABT6DN95_9BACT|nr:hypothetical protein [Bdellovibrio svalbardensis]MDG0818263.1 hypothetical protein [Bdellovibrio svalbardensis]
MEIEKAKLEALGWQSTDLSHIPMSWNPQNNFEPACEMIKTALLILEQNYAAEKATYVHCSVGEDRTSLLAALWKIWKRANSKLQTSDAPWIYETYKNEMCRYGYGMGLVRTNKPLDIVQKIEASLTPLYVAVASEIINIKKRNGDLGELSCSSLKPVQVNYKCEPNMTFQTNQTKGELYE